MGAESDWQLHADWQLGRVSDADYADALVRGGADEHDAVVQLLRRRNHPARGDQRQCPDQTTRD